MHHLPTKHVLNMMINYEIQKILTKNVYDTIGKLKIIKPVPHGYTAKFITEIYLFSQFFFFIISI